jgi:hypothetical protein
LTLNGRKKKLKPADFQQAAQRASVTDKVIAGLFTKFTRVKPAWYRFINNSFMSLELRQGYHALLDRLSASYCGKKPTVFWSYPLTPRLLGRGGCARAAAAPTPESGWAAGAPGAR